MTAQDALRDKIADALAQFAVQDNPHSLSIGIDRAHEAADAVLAFLDLGKIRAEAWDEGSAAGWNDAMRYEASGWGECEWAGLIKNPYRPEGEER